MYEGRTVLVTGGTGMIGSYIARRLIELGAEVRIVAHQRMPNLTSRDAEIVWADLRVEGECRRVMKGVDFVFHAAAVVGGVAKNAADPAQIFTQNVLLNTNVLEAARAEEVERYLLTSNNSVYPSSDRPSREDEAWEGPPDPSVTSAGWVRRMAELQATLYAQQYGMKIGIIRATNSFGRWDNFDPQTSHVIPALVRRASEKQNPFIVWGTGENLRDFTHASDIARGMIMTLERHAVCDPVNICSGRAVKLREVVDLILDLAGHDDASVVFDPSRPGGQMTKLMDNSRGMQVIGFEAKVSLEAGLRDTIEWYISQTAGH